MNTVFLKTRELGQALLESEEYQVMKQAEADAMQDEETANLLAAYLEKKQEVENLLVEEEPNTQKLKELSDAMSSLQEEMQQKPKVIRMTESREVFSNLIKQINQLLQFIVTGEMGEEGGCTGSCSTCGGCD